MRRGRELDEVSATLAEVQARQQSLSQGAVLARASSPPVASSPLPVAAREAAPRRPPPTQWLKRRVVCRSGRQGAALEDLGTLELLPSASLSAARALVAQFVALLPRREFRFVHPTTGAGVDVAKESSVPVAGLPFLCIALQPMKEKVSASAAVEAREQRGRRPVTALQQPIPQQTKLRPRTVESSTKGPTTETVKVTIADAVVERVPPPDKKEKIERTNQLALPADGEARKVVEGDREKDGKPACAPAASAGSKRMTGELKLALEPPATSRAGILGKPEVKLSQGQLAVRKPSGKLGDTTHQSTSICPAKEIGAPSSTKDSEALLIVGEREPVRGFSPRTSAPRDNKSTLAATLLNNQDVVQEKAAHDGVRSDVVEVDATPEATPSSEKETYRKPGPLRRSRHFKALSVAKLAERIWNTEEPGDQELVFDEHVEKLIGGVVEVFYTGLPGVDPNQLHAACQFYGIDYQGLGLQGLLLALDGEITAKCNHVRGGVDGQLTQYLLKLLPAELESVQDLEVVRHFENALNLFAGMRGWQAPTLLRASVLEDKQRLQLIPASDGRRFALLRLTDKDRQLFALASTGNASTGLEKWLADALEITYVLLYGFLQSRRNSGPKSLAKMEAVHGRQDRIQAAVQKLSSFNFEVWKRLEFRTSDIEDISMVRRLSELLRGFVRGSKLYSGDVEGSVFFPAIVGYLARKSDQLGQSLSGLLDSPTRGPQQSAALECLRLLQQQLQQRELHSTATETYLANRGLRIINVDKINAWRSSSGLGRIFVSGKESILTQYQCKMMARDPALHLKARWEQPKLPTGKVSRYFSIGAKNTALEYTFVRTKVDTSSGDNTSWEDREALGEREAQKAFELLCGESLAVPLDAAVGVGISLIHTDLLPHISSLLSLNIVLREYSATTSISLGYCYEPATCSTRVVFRVHADACKARRHDDDGDTAERWRLPSVIKAVDRFLCCASDEEAVAFCDSEGLCFLHSCLQEQGSSLRTIKFGMPFSESLYRVDDAVACQRASLLQTIKRTVAIIPHALQSITRQNIQIIIQLIEDFPESLDLCDEAVAALQAICSNGRRSVLIGLQSESMYSVFPMTSVQRKFSAEGGLDILISAVTRLQEHPARKEALESAIVTLLTVHECSSSRSGLLAHWREWLEFYVDKQAWKLSAVTPAFSVLLLRQLHGQFFASNGFVEPIAEMCSCGCNRQPADVLDACAGNMQIFLRLMLSEVGVTWAQEEMQGPQDCVSFLSWSVGQNSSRMEVLQQLILQSLCEFLERLTSSHQYLQILSVLTPQLLALLIQPNCPSMHSSTLRCLSIIFRLAVDKKVWVISMETFLTAYYQILESVCDDPSSSSMNTFMMHVLLRSEYPEGDACFSSNILHLLHEEHGNFIGGSGQLSPVARSSTKSLLQSLVSLCSLTWNSALQPHCQIPAVISLGWMLNSLEVAEDLALLELDEVLVSLMESDNSVLSILATQACSIFFFQALQSRRVMDEHRLKRVCNLLTTALGSGTRLMLSPKRGSDTLNPDTIQFAMNQHDLYVKLRRYSAFNSENHGRIQQQELVLDDTPEAEPLQATSIWENSDWSDSSRASAEKLTANLKLLTVFSSMTTNIGSIGNCDEIRQIILLLVRFVRDRMHSTPHHVTLYLLPLRNIIWATRSELAKRGVLELTEATFLRKLLLMSMDRVHQELASAILWGLADAYEKTNTFLLSFEVDDALTKGSYFTKKTGLAVLTANLSSKIAAGHCVESEAGALASIIANSTSGGIFVTDYGYPFVLKLIDSSLRSTITGHVVGSIGRIEEEPSTVPYAGELFGSTLFYSHPIKHQKDRELLQLCCSATKVLETMLRVSPESILDEAARTKATMLPLLNYPNKHIVLYAIRCCSFHLQGHPTKCGKLFVPEVQDKVIAFFFDETFPPIQATAFSCMKLALADQQNLVALQAKISALQERIVSCLRSPHFQVKRKVIVFLVEAIFRFDDQTFLNAIAAAFATPENEGIIMGLFDSLSKEIETNPAAAGALQSVIRLILKLDLVAHTNGDQLVHAICLTLKAHSTDTFLRPTLFDCLCQIVTQDDRVVYLERKSRLDAITCLLSQQLTLNELRNVASMLFTVAHKHDGIRRYLSKFSSGCIPKVVGVISAFFEYAKDSNTVNDAPIQDEKTSSSEVAAGTLQRTDAVQDSSGMVLLKVATAKTVYISHFTEDIYEQFLKLLLLLITGPGVSAEERYGCLCEEGGCLNCDPCDIIAKTRCGHPILRIAAAHRVLCTTYDLANLRSATGEAAETILSLSTEVLEILCANHQCRVQMLRGSAKLEWSWVPYLVRNVGIPDYPTLTADQSRAREASAVHSILLLGHLSAVKEVAQRLVTDTHTVSLLFSYLSPSRDPSISINVDIRRAASFALARLAEHPAAVRESFFQERMAMLTYPVATAPDELDSSEGERDTIVLVNRMTLGRNRALLTPGLQGRSVDDATLTLLMQLLVPPRTDDTDWTEAGVGLIAADVLSHLLFFRVNARDEKRLQTVLWRYARAMSPTKPTSDQNRPSSKRLTAFLHNWIGPMLQTLRQSAFGASRGDTLQLLREELSYSCQQLDEGSTVSELLRVLVGLHIESGAPRIETETPGKEVSDPLDSDDKDVIMPYTFKGAILPRKTYHVAFNEADRSTREASDDSFRGSSHLWLFLQKLWELTNEELKNGNDRAVIAVTTMKEIVRAAIPTIFKRWRRELGTRFSLSAFAKRQSFLEFVIAISEGDPGVLSVVDVETILEIVVGFAQDSTATLGREYHLLCRACQHIPRNIELILQCFRPDDSEHEPNERFRLFWQRVRLSHLPVQMVFPAAEAASKTTLLDFSPDTSLAMIFGMELLKMLTLCEPLTMRWYALHQGATQLLDMLLLASRASALQLQHLMVRSFLSNLLYLVDQLVELDREKYRCIFERDPRYIRCVVDLIYTPAHEVQSSAIKLVQSLALYRPLFGMISLLESLTQPLGSVKSEGVAYVKEILSRHQVSPPFRQDRVVLLAHIWLVPFLMDLSVTELVKLSLGFSSCTEAAEDSWVLLSNDFRFNAIPEWMLEANASAQASFNDAMKHIQKLFERALLQHRQVLSMYGITKESYMSATTVATRRRVALRLGSLLRAYHDESKMYRNSVRSRNGLVMRLGRLLVEDRAEIIRRVAYTKRIPERVLFDQMQDQQLSDLLTLLQENPLFEDVPRDHLANLALRLGSPVAIAMAETGSKQRLPLLLVYDEAVEFEMCVQGNEKVLRGTLPRGGLLGFPPWLENAVGRDQDNWTVVHKCQLLATIISKELLVSELPAPTLSLVKRRLQQAYEIGDVQAISELMGLQAPQFASGRRRLQTSASSLLVQLTAADVFMNNLLSDSWAIRIIVDVAQAALPPGIVLNALAIVAAMTATEAFAKRFCTKAMRNRTHGKAAEIPSPLSLVGSLVNQFKLQLWLSHPEILKKFFLVQAQVACYLPSFWTNLEKIWTAEYMCSCLDLMRSGSPQIIDVVGCHLSGAIPHRADFLLDCGSNTDFHLALATILSHTHSGNIVGVLRLFNAFCVNEKLREEIWENVVASSHVFDGSLQQVASAISECFDQNNNDDIEAYCTFLHLLCSSGVDDILDSEFQKGIESLFGILSMLLARLPQVLGTHMMRVVLRSIGSICSASKANSEIAATLMKDDPEEPILANAVVSALIELKERPITDKDADLLLVEATFSCVASFTTGMNRMKSFSPATLAAVALQIIRDSTATPKSLTSTTIPALAAVVRSMRRVLALNQDDYLAAFTSDNSVRLVCAGYECLSGNCSESDDDIELQRLLGAYTGLLDVLLSSRRYCDLLWTTCIRGAESSSLFVTWVYHWITFNAAESPKVKALMPARTKKHHRLLAIADKVQAATLALATSLSKHEGFSEILGAHPDFGKVVAHVFASLSTSNSDDAGRAIAWVKLLCFMAEQWDTREIVEKHQAGEHQHRSRILRAFLPYVSAQTLLKACRLERNSQDSFVCYAMRFLWLLVKLQSSFPTMPFGCEELLELVSLASDILQKALFSRRTKCYVVGLLAELSADEALLVSLVQAPGLDDVVKSGLMLLKSDPLATSQELTELNTAMITDDFLSSRRWSTPEDQDEEVRFGISHEMQRLILHLYKVAETRQVLASASFFHPTVCRTVFVESIALLRSAGKSSVWITAQLVALELMAALLAPKDAECKHSFGSSPLRSYRLVARREGLLQHCICRLLEEQTHSFQLAVIESLLRYVDQHISAHLEVAALREQGRGDLMNVLLSIQNVPEATQEAAKPRLSQRSLQLYKSCIEFSFQNALYAAKSANLSVFTKLRQGAVSQDTLLRSNLPQTLYCLAKMLGGSNCGVDPCLVGEIWELACAVLLHPEVVSHLNSLVCVLETLKCSESWQAGLCGIVVREWEERGSLVVECLVGFVNYDPTSEAEAVEEHGATIAELSAMAIMRICSSAQVCENICNDTAMVASVLHHSSDKRLQPMLLKFLLAWENTRLSHLSAQILDRLAEMYQLNRETRLFLFELLPSVACLLDRCDGLWSDILACILAEINRNAREDGSQEAQLTTARALCSVVKACDLETIPLDVILDLHVVLQRLTGSSTAMQDCAPSILQDENWLNPSVVVPKPAVVELMLLYSLNKLSPYVETDLPLPKQFGLSCCSSWIYSGTSRGYDVQDGEVELLLNRFVFHYVCVCDLAESHEGVLHFVPYWRVVVRMFIRVHDGELYRGITKLLLQLVQGPASHNFQEFASNTMGVDLINALWWRVLPISRWNEEAMLRSRGLWCSLLHQLCCSRANGLSIMEKRFLEEFILLENRLSSDSTLEQPGNASLLRLLAAVFRVTSPSDHEVFLRKDPTAMETLAEHCIRTISAILGNSGTKWHATQVLFALSSHERPLAAIRKSCGLDLLENPAFDPENRRLRLCALSELLLLRRDDIEDLAQVLRLILKICGAGDGTAALIRARSVSDCWPMVDVLVEVLQRCMLPCGDTSASGQSQLRPILLSTTDPAEFLPRNVPTEAHAKATVAALQLVYLCVVNDDFAETLKPEIDLLEQLLACLATSNWAVSSTAAAALRSLIGSAEDLDEENGNATDISRYVCGNGMYRKLEFFASLDAQNTFAVSPPSLYPACFVLWTRWVRFYSVNLHFLGSSESVVAFDATDEDPSQRPPLPNVASHAVHETIVASVLDLLLYCVSNFHSEIYKTDNGEEEEREHALLLQSLLALCQRRFSATEDAASSAGGDTCVVVNGRIRSRALELVQLLCSLDLPRTSSVRVFASAKQMTTLMMIVERSASTVEQCAASQLIEALALHEAIKDLLVGTSSLLSRLGAWLEKNKLQLLAADIIQRLATPSVDSKRSAGVSMFRFSPSVQQQLSHFLIVGQETGATASLDPRETTFRFNRTRPMAVTIQLEDREEQSPRASSTAALVLLRLGWKLLSQSGRCLRSFQYDGTLQHDKADSIQYELMLEQAVATIHLTVAVWSAVDSKESCHELELPVEDTSSSLQCGDTDTIRITQRLLGQERSCVGVLPRLLRQERRKLSPELFQGLSGIVAEFGKSFILFCDPVIDLPCQILVALATSVAVSPVGRMDVACLDALATWFPSKPSVAFFKKSIPPLLHLIRGLRRLACVTEYTAHEQPSNDAAGADPDPPQCTFLERFVQLIASVEVADLTPNCLNVVFMENADVLLNLCAQVSPEQDPNTTFLSLVATAIRSNVAHCQTFLTSSAQLLLRSVFDVGMKTCDGRSEHQQRGLLSCASLVVVRLARCPRTTHDSSTVAARLELFSRVSFEVFARREWAEGFPHDAARNLVLACGFLSDGIAKPVAVDAGSSEAEKYASLFGASDAGTSGIDPLYSSNRLAVVETLLLFLGRPTSLEDDGPVTSDSVDRLAARVLAALVEKLPARKHLEQRILELLDKQSSASNPGDVIPDLGSRLSWGERCLSGLRRCLMLTRFDLQSDLNALRLTYYSSIRAGVRTGVIPPQCSGVFQRFDQEHLLPTQKPQWHLDEINRSRAGPNVGDRPSVSSSKHLVGEDSKLEAELRELLLFANGHAELLSVLTVNRKKAMTTALRVATRNARVLVAFHAMTSIALDFYIDSVKRLQGQRKRKRRSSASAMGNLGSAEQATVMEWLLLLEELAGLLCSGLHELDAAYYTEIARQFKALVMDLPVFLRKMERLGTHSRPQALLLFLDNLHRLLKRATNRNELRVVAVNGSGVVDQTKTVRERLKRLDTQLSASLGAVLEPPDGMEGLSRALVAMSYMWRRTMGASSLEKAMATSKESASLLKKIRDKFVAGFRAVRRPRKVLRAVFLVLLKLGAKSQAVKSQRFDSPATPSSLTDTNSRNTDQSSSERGAGSLVRGVDELLSPFPFNSLELALDHFGWEALSAKRTRQLLKVSPRKASVVELLGLAFGIGEDAVERLSVLELAERFHKLQAGRKLAELLEKLEELVLDEEMAFTALPCVSHDKMGMSLWRLMVRPVQRLRLFHLYQQTQRFATGDRAKRKRLLDGYRQDSPQKPAPLNDTPSTRKSVPPSDRRNAVGQGLPVSTPGALSLTAKVLIPQPTLSVCDGILSRDPLSDDAAMRLLRKKNKETGAAGWRGWVPEYVGSARYHQDQHDSLADRALRVVVASAARLVLVLAFWRQDELRADLHDPVMARAFDDPRARDDYYRLYHAKKGLGELVRVWMPSSGRLGLSLWQERRYALGGTLTSIGIALWLPLLVSPGASDGSPTATAASERNMYMTRIVYSYGTGIFVLSVVSIALIAQNRFVLLEQTRLRLRPISRYYQNFMAVAAIVVELVQLNSLAFDPAVEWDDTDELPAAMQWLGQQGLTRFGVSSASELQALGILLLLLSWFLLLKCANKFQDTSVLLHRVLTKDLPALVNGFFYMGTISAFFSFLACVDCSRLRMESDKCALAPQSPPFLIAYPSITCWSPEHQWYALLGLWGITFFLPIGLLAHGMGQVLFQRETLDIKYAPVLLLVTQLVKAVAATAQAFFPFEPLALASLGFVGNGVLFILTLAMHSCSLWYIKYVKCGIYAASCWASLGAIHRLHYAGESSARSLNMIYFGWLSILLATAAAILLRVWRRARAKQRDADLRFAAQQRLLNVGKAAAGLGAVEQTFLKAAKRHSRDALTRAAHVSNAARLTSSAPPPVLKDFVARATDGSEYDTPQGVLFMQNARALAKKLRRRR